MAVTLLLRLFVWLWFGTAVAAGHFEVLQRLPRIAVVGLLLSVTAVILLLVFRVRPVRSWIDSLDLRALVLVHLTRFAGIYFLVLFQRGELPRAFALSGGIGDIIVATMALPVAFAPLADDARRRVIAIWNVAGFVDLLLVIAAAVRVHLADPAQLRVFTHLPLSLLPTFLVPLLIVTHVIVFARTARTETAA